MFSWNTLGGVWVIQRGKAKQGSGKQWPNPLLGTGPNKVASICIEQMTTVHVAGHQRGYTRLISNLNKPQFYNRAKESEAVAF